MNRRAAILKWMLISLLFLTALVVALWQLSNARCFALAGDLTCRVETREKLVALTFDDGPTPLGVEHALAVLDRYDVRATFFLIGGEMESQPAFARRLVEAGREIGNHSYSHVRMVGSSSDFYESEIARTDALLRRAGAVEPTLFRPPYGKKLIGLPLAVERLGYRTVMWDVEDPPGGGADARSYAHHIVNSARPGSIILMHLMYPANHVAREALPLIIEGLKARGFRIVTAGELIGTQD